MLHMKLLPFISCAGGAVMALIGPVSAAEQPFKLTLGSYDTPSNRGTDVNLRWRQDDTNAWVGYYRDADFGSQWRTGFDSNVDLTDWASLQPSLQLASQGFVGGSLNLQLGQQVYGVVGIGRTNLRPYFNLNFDPNDAVTLGLGWRGEQGQNLALTLVADDRLHTGQKHLHLTGRWPLAGGERLTLDLLCKQGMGDAGMVRAWGWSIGYDWPRWFAKLAHDPKQNFGVDDVTRLSVGVRF
jgi:hypothetical protein